MAEVRLKHGRRELIAQAGPSTAAPAPTVSDAQLGLFARGVVALLSAWPALRIAIEEHWGGNAGGETGVSKRSALAEELVDAFYTSEPDVDALEDFLVEFVEVEFGLMVEDGSEEAIVRDLRTLWTAVSSGPVGQAEAIVAEFQRLAGSRLPGSVTRAPGDNDSDDEESAGQDGDESMDVDTPAVAPAPKPERVVDDDGFELVQSRSKRR